MLDETQDRRYRALLQTLREASHLYRAREHLYCDMVTNMPNAGCEALGDTLAYLEAQRHKLLTTADYGDLVRRLGEECDRGAIAPDSLECHVIGWARKDYELQSRVPTAFVAAQAKVNAAGSNAWEAAKEANSWAHFAPFFAEVLHMAREYAEIIGYEHSPYDVYLDRYDPGLTAARTEEILGGLVGPTTALIRRIAGSPHRLQRLEARHVSKELLEKGCRAVIADMGFDFDAGRLVQTEHPFCDTVHPGDTWLALRYDPDKPLDAISTAVHEAGHGINGQRMPRSLLFTPVGHHRSYSLSESQSRLWEVIIGASRPFAEYLEKRLKGIWPAPPKADAIYRHMNVVMPSFIRIEADEVTYGLHIYTRFRTERELFERRLEAEDVPEYWNALFEKLLGLRVTEDRHGPLQDSHWADGSFGYFPSYTVGNIYSAHFGAALRRDIGDLDGCIRSGEFRPISDWLDRRVYVHGARHTADELVEKATGFTPSAELFVRYQDEKFSELYKL